MGRRRKPAEEQARKGNPGRRKLQPAPITLPPGCPAPPPGLGPEGLALWGHLAPTLEAAGLLRRSDDIALAMLCDALALYWTVSAALRAEGVVYETSSPHTEKMRRLAPEYAVRDREGRRAITLMDRFGMSPVARAAVFAHLSRLQAPSAGGADHPPAPTSDSVDVDLFGDPIGLLQ